MAAIELFQLQLTELNNFPNEIKVSFFPWSFYFKSFCSFVGFAVEFLCLIIVLNFMVKRGWNKASLAHRHRWRPGFGTKIFCYGIKQKDSILPCVCSVINYRRRQNVVRTSVTHSPNGSLATFFVLTTF